VPYHAMTDQQVRAFLTALPARTGKLATVRPDGRPHVAPRLFGSRNGVPGELVVRLRPAHMTSAIDLAD